MLAEANVFRKNVLVRAERALSGAVVRTMLPNGLFETVNVASEGDWLITNPGGEQYLLDASSFHKRYESTDSPGVYRSVGKVRALLNPYGEGVSILAPWGEVQYGDADCWFASPVGDDEVYIIGGVEMMSTYSAEEDF